MREAYLVKRKAKYEIQNRRYEVMEGIQMKRKEKAFTIVELLVVILIISMLAVFVAPRMFHFHIQSIVNTRPELRYLLSLLFVLISHV